MKILIGAIPPLLFLISVNYFGDAANIFHSEYEKNIAEIITNGKFATNLVNFDDRLVQEKTIKNLNFKPDIVVIGSSRTMLIRDSYFPGNKLFNNSVAGASLEDLVAIYQIYKEEDKLPKKIILGIDPWHFNEFHNQKRWESINSYYYRFFGKPVIGISTTKIEQLFSLSYFQNSLRNMFTELVQEAGPIATTNLYNKTNTKLSDGPLTYGENTRSSSNEKVLKIARRLSTGDIYSLENFNQISEKYWNIFNDLLTDMRLNNIEIEFFLSPYHPIVSETRLKADLKIVQEVEKQIKELASKKGIEVHGSFDPEEENLGSHHFYDGMHANEEGIKKILEICSSSS